MKRVIRIFLDTIRDLLGAVLSDHVIMQYNKRGVLVEQPISPSQLQPNSVDLTLGMTWKKLKPNSTEWAQIGGVGRPIIDPKLPIEFTEGEFVRHLNSKDGSKCPDDCFNCNLEDCINPRYYILEPGEFVLMASNEILNIPNGILAFAQGRSSIARLAIQTEQAGLIDAGFRGTITFEVINQGDTPVILYPGMRIAQVWFVKAQRSLIPYGNERNSKYNNQIKATESRNHLDVEFQKNTTGIKSHKDK